MIELVVYFNIDGSFITGIPVSFERKDISSKLEIFLSNSSTIVPLAGILTLPC